MMALRLASRVFCYFTSVCSWLFYNPIINIYITSISIDFSCCHIIIKYNIVFIIINFYMKFYSI